MNKTLDDYRSMPGRFRSCRVCGALPAARVVLSLQERKVNPNKDADVKNRMMHAAIHSRSGTFCEACAIKAYEDAVAAAGLGLGRWANP